MTEPTAHNLMDLEKQLKVTWGGVESLPVQLTNQFLIQVDVVDEAPESVVLAMGMATPPVVLGTEEERAEQLRLVESVPVQPLARYAMTPGRLAQLITLLQNVQMAMHQNDPSVFQRGATS